MPLMLLQYPVIPALLLVTALLVILAPHAKHGQGVLTVLAGLCAAALVLAALCLSLPDDELLLLLALLTLAAFLSRRREVRP